VSELLQRQQDFAYLVGKLLVWCTETSHPVTLGEAYRSDEQAEINAMGPANRVHAADLLALRFPDLATKIRNNVGSGIRTSLHGDRLAIDLQLFDVLGNYQTEAKAYEPLGRYWESLGGSWGGRFGDANHFSLEFGGRK
jgi:hypothetical protein